MTIDGIKYEDVFYICVGERHSCFICSEEIKENEQFYSEKSIFSNQEIIKPITVCLKCTKSPEQLEKAMPLLMKSIYRGTIEIKRLNSISGVNKNFYY